MMKISLVECFLVVASCIHFTSSASFPKTWLRCKQSDPEINKCLINAVTDAFRKMKNKGVPSLGVFPIDPLDVTAMDVIDGGSGPVSLNLKFKNMQIHGIAESTVTGYNISLKDVNNFHIYSRSLTPAYRLVGDYAMSGRLLLLPIQGKGHCDITLDQLDTEHFMTGAPFTVKDQVYINITDYRIILNPKRLYMKFENLFNGDKRLGETMNTFMNDNWQDILREIKPSLEVSFGSLFKEMSNRIFLKLPMNEIFLP